MKTNADKIREMTDAELAELLAAVADWMYEVDFGGDESRWLEWLEGGDLG